METEAEEQELMRTVRMLGLAATEMEARQLVAVIKGKMRADAIFAVPPPVTMDLPRIEGLDMTPIGLRLDGGGEFAANNPVNGEQSEAKTPDA